MMRRIRFFVAVKRGRRVWHYWQPSTPLRKAGWAPKRLSDDPMQATIEAERLNAELDAARAEGDQHKRPRGAVKGRNALPEPKGPYRVRRRRDERRGIYLIADRSGRVKVGIASDPFKRLVALQTGNPDKLTLVLWLHGAGMDAADMEAWAHRCLHIFRREGEWFRVETDRAIETVVAAWKARPKTTV